MLRDVKVVAEPRTLKGKRTTRKLARRGLVPGILYGGAGEPVMFQLDPRKLDAVLALESGTNTLFEFTIGAGGTSLAMIRDTQQDPVTGRLLHADLLRISLDRAIEVRVPVHLTGIAKGVKEQGGILDFTLREVEISCLPGDIPERIDVDVTGLALGQAVKISDVVVSDKLKVLSDPNKPIAVVVAPAAERSAEAAAAEAVAEAPAEPEVIKKGKAEAGEEGAEKEPEKGGGKEKGGR